MSGRPAPAPGGAGRWRLAAPAVPGLFGGVVLLLAGLLLGRADVAVLGVPLVLTVLWGLGSRPASRPTVVLGTLQHRPTTSTIAAPISIGGGTGIVRLRISAPSHRAVDVMVDGRICREVEVSVRTARTGAQELFRIDHLALAGELAWAAGPDTEGPGSVRVLPRIEPLHQVPLPSRLHGLTGMHRTALAGEGGDFRDVARFRPGDRLKHLDWKATARRAGGVAATWASGSELYVRRTFATADAHVVLVLDPRDDIGPEVATWETGNVHPDDVTSLDLARRAVTSLARHYLDQGDRVGFVDLSWPERRLRPAAGRRQLNRIAHHLAVAAPPGERRHDLQHTPLPSGVLVVVLSTFLDDQAASLARAWRYDGHRVFAIDVAPPLVADALPARARIGLRLLELERAERLATLGDLGIEVLCWAGEGQRHGEVAVRLETLARARTVRR